MSFQHGGQLDRIKQEYPDQVLPWIDLSTGISPFSYPAAINLESSLQSLPQQHAQMTRAACEYYGAKNTLVVPGSMWAIQTLPLIRSQLVKDDRRPVLIPKQGFNEHAKAWQNWGFKIEYYADKPTDGQLGRAQVCVVINPNNPTGHLFDKALLELMHEILLLNDAWLIVDEAFLDLTPELSLADAENKKGLLVLKSFGKYFGLPGLRVGALIADLDITAFSQRLLNEWTISSVAQNLVTNAWRDRPWQVIASRNINACSQRLKVLLSKLGLITRGTSFFQTLTTPQARELYGYLLIQGIYVRLLDDESGVRMGLPQQEWHWQRLEQALAQFLNVST